MHKMLLEVPTHIETERLYLRPFGPGDGEWYYAMSQRNRAHLMRYEAENVALSIRSAEEAEILVRELAVEWGVRDHLFWGAFEKASAAFVAQIYVGVVDWALPEFRIGYFADVDHEGQGYVTEAVKATLHIVFEHLKAHRVRIECDDTNERSCRVAERCGFVREGHFRENKKNADGIVSGTLYFGLLRAEFEADDL
jgi:RimJ/RimL family protein N-acetyltransferase